MKRISLKEFFETIKSLDSNIPNGIYDLARIKDEGIGVKRYGKTITILEKYSESDFDVLYKDIIDKIKEYNWGFLPARVHSTAFASGEYSGYSAWIGIDTKSVILNIQDVEIAKKFSKNGTAFD